MGTLDGPKSINPTVAQTIAELVGKGMMELHSIMSTQFCVLTILPTLIIRHQICHNVSLRNYIAIRCSAAQFQYIYIVLYADILHACVYCVNVEHWNMQ